MSPDARAARHSRHDTGRLLQSSAIVGLGTALSRVTGFLRVAAIAYALGVTTMAGVYSYANETPNIVYELLLGGVLTFVIVTFVRGVPDLGQRRQVAQLPAPSSCRRQVAYADAGRGGDQQRIDQLVGGLAGAADD